MANTLEITKIEQQKINDAVWKACDTFRGVVDAGQYKDYILIMLFLKYISDTWNAKIEHYKAQFDCDMGRVERRMANERFVVPQGASFYDLLAKQSADNLGEEFDIAFAKLEDANKEKLAGVFRDISFNSESNLGKTKDRNKRLQHLLNDFNHSDLQLTPDRVEEDVIGEAYMYLIDKFGSDAGKKAGEFYTPANVSSLVAKLADASQGATIYDPACGAGSLLIKTASQTDSKNFSLYGQEVNGQTWAMCRMNMFLHAMDSANIEWGNTLAEPLILENDKLKQFDVVVANPPFSLDKWGAETAEADKHKRFWRGIPPKSKGDYAFISHMIESAKIHSGKVVVVAPHGVLFRGSSEGKIRQSLIDDNLLDAVIGLPAGMFSTTGIPVAILIFDRSREQGGKNAKRNDIVFIDASNEFDKSGKQNVLTDAHLQKIYDTYKARENVEKYCSIIGINEIQENDYNLNIPRYVDTFEEEEEIDLDKVVAEIKIINDQIADVDIEIKKYCDELGIKPPF